MNMHIYSTFSKVISKSLTATYGRVGIHNLHLRIHDLNWQSLTTDTKMESFNFDLIK